MTPAEKAAAGTFISGIVLGIGLIISVSVAGPGVERQHDRDPVVATQEPTPTQTPSRFRPPPPRATVPTLNNSKAAAILCGGGAVDFTKPTAQQAFAGQMFGQGSYLFKFKVRSLSDFVEDESLFTAADSRCPKKWMPLAEWWAATYDTMPRLLGLKIGLGTEKQTIGTGSGFDINLAYRNRTTMDCQRMEMNRSDGADGFADPTNVDGFEAVQQCYRTAAYFGN